MALAITNLLEATADAQGSTARPVFDQLTFRK
jgi:hypothetical protein